MKDNHNLDKVLLVATGGTIAMHKDAAGKVVPAVGGNDLLTSLPELRAKANWLVIDFSNVASCNMSPNRMLALARQVEECLRDSAIKGTIITHGTDTLEETAYFLDITIRDTRPIILTASQRDASESDSDGPRNLRNAMLIAQNSQAVGRGVVIALNEEIHAARDVRKLHTSHVDAFNSGEIGALGSIDDGEVIWHRKPEASIKLGIPTNLVTVPICKAYTGMSARTLENLVEDGAQAVVIEAFGRGNVPPEVVPGINRLVTNGVPVVITSRCLFGRTAPVYGYPGGGGDLEQVGAWFAADLSSEKVRLILSVALGMAIPLTQVQVWLRHGWINN